VDTPRSQRLLSSLAIGFLPGALFGLHLAGLVFFLNPDLPFEPLSVLRGMAYYGGLLGLASLILHALGLAAWGLWHRLSMAEIHRAAVRLFPWSLSLALALAAFYDGLHASIFAFYVPPGINVRLIKTAVWLGLGALIAFYTALLHSLHRRRYGIRSRAALLLLALASIYVLVERREAFHPRPRPVPLPSTADTQGRPSLLLVGVDGLSLDAILPLAEEGELPFFGRMIQDGASGRIQSISPPFTEALWTSLATGKYPYQHRVFGSRAYRAPFLRERAALRLLPRVPQFAHWGTGPAMEELEASTVLPAWQILPRLGVPTGVIDWPGASADEDDVLFNVPPGFFLDPDTGVTTPMDVAERARLFRPQSDPPLPAGVLADEWREALALVLLDQFRSTEALFVHLPGLGTTSEHFFGGYWKHQFEGARHGDYVRAADIVSGHYRRLDRFLQSLWEERRGPTLLVVVSAHGTEMPRGWRRALRHLVGGRPLRGDTSHAPDGAVLLFGDGIAAGARLSGTRLVDVAPTVFYGLGLPLARDLDGQIIMDAFEPGFLARRPLTFLPSYETLQAP
jgi:hypothetical protein